MSGELVECRISLPNYEFVHIHLVFLSISLPVHTYIHIYILNALLSPGFKRRFLTWIWCEVLDGMVAKWKTNLSAILYTNLIIIINSEEIEG